MSIPERLSILEERVRLAVSDCEKENTWQSYEHLKTLRDCIESEKRGLLEEKRIASEDARCHSDGPCMDCGRRDVAFSVAHKLWAEVLGLPPGENPGILCPKCFTGRATDRGITLGIWNVGAVQKKAAKLKESK